MLALSLSSYAPCAQNVFVGVEDVMKIADFGLAVQLESDEELWKRSWGGTPGYWAPEVEAGYKLKESGDTQTARRKGAHGLNADVWSMGKLIKYIAEDFNQSDLNELANFACVEDRASRPTSLRLLEKLNQMKQDRDTAAPLNVAVSMDGDTSTSLRTKSLLIDGGDIADRVSKQFEERVQRERKLADENAELDRRARAKLEFEERLRPFSGRALTSVERKTLELVSELAIKGAGEKQALRGLFFIVGNGKEVLKCGKIKMKSQDYSDSPNVSVLEDPAGEFTAGAEGDGAIVIDLSSGDDVQVAPSSKTERAVSAS